LIEEKSFDIDCFFLSFDFKKYIGISFDHLNFKKGDHSPNCIAILIITISADLLSYCFGYLTTFYIVLWLS